MRGRIIIALLCFLLKCLAFAYGQAHIQGIVLEYNEKQKKTPLGQVEILVQNAGSTVSNADGHFILNFRTLKPGDKVVVRRIEKPQYEIFNRDALDQWTVSRRGDELFTIVMCRSDKFKRLRDKYFQVASQSYALQMKKERDQLAALKREGKLLETEYQSKLQRLSDEYEERLEHLDNYVDRFARIDLSELSKQEAHIIEMVQQGDIDGAIKAYEDMELEYQYEEAAKNRQKTKNAIDSLEARKKAHEAYRDSIQKAIERRDSLKYMNQ